ncbi:MAG: hypothetical protein OXH05_13775 [Acidobacteria bacterium]|nr:hypothetical protein [Acidobacteriota bacterium]
MTALPRELPPNVRVYHIAPPPRESVSERQPPAGSARAAGETHMPVL